MKPALLLTFVTLIASHVFSQVSPPEVIAYPGMEFPAGSGRTLYPWGQVAVSPNGQITAFGTTEYLSPYESSFMLHQNGVLSEVVFFSDVLPSPMPPGSTIGIGAVRSVNDSGDVAFFARSTVNLGGAEGEFLYDAAAGAVVPLLVKGASVPGLPGYVVSGFVGYQMYPNTVAFANGALARCLVTAVQPTQDPYVQALVYRDRSGTFTCFPVRAQAGSLFRLSELQESVASNELAFRANHDQQTGTNPAVVRLNPATGLHNIVAEHGQPIGSSDALGDIQSFSLSTEGDLALIAMVEDGEGAIRQSLVWISRDGVQSEVLLRAGDTMNTGAGLFTIRDFVYTPRAVWGSFGLCAADDEWTYTLARLSQPNNVFLPGDALIRARPGHPPQVMMWPTSAVRGGPLHSTLRNSWEGSSVFVLAPQPFIDRIYMVTNLVDQAPPWSQHRVLFTWDDSGNPTVLLAAGNVLHYPTYDYTVSQNDIYLSTVYAATSESVVVRLYDSGAVLRIRVPPSDCGDIDFNNDLQQPDTQDVADFLNVMAGGDCQTPRCDSIDFNRDGVFPDAADVELMLLVLSGGSCQ